MQTTYQAEQIRHFLEAVDKHLAARAELTIIGGGAALLQHGARSPTRDIDTFDKVGDAVMVAARKAAAELEFAVPIGPAAVAVCKEIHEANPLVLDALLDRYLTEMDHAIGRPEDRDQNLAAAVEYLWDVKTADLAQQRIQSHREEERAKIERSASAKRGGRGHRRR